MPASAAPAPNEALQFARRVLIICQRLPVPFDRRVWQQATELTRQGYIVSVICPRGMGHTAASETLEGIHILRHAQPFEAKGTLGYAFEYIGSLLWEFMLTGKVFFTTGFDVIQASNPPDTICFIGGFFKLFFGKKFVYDQRIPAPEMYEAKFSRNGMLYAFMRWMERLCFKIADVCIVANESCRLIAQERGKVTEAKIFLVRSGPSLERIKIKAAVAEHKKKRRYLVGYAGVMNSQSGIHHLIEAVRIIVHDRERSDIHFAFIGEGPDLAKHKKAASLLDVADFISFTGLLVDKELLEVLNSCDICVAPDKVTVASDKYTTAKVMEYMALGKPVVQFETGEGRFSAGESSLYATPGDPEDLANTILRLLEDPEKRKQMGEAGRARIENTLAWSYEAPRLLAAYDTAFSPPGE